MPISAITGETQFLPLWTGCLRLYDSYVFDIMTDSVVFFCIAKRLPRVQPVQNPSGMILMDRPAERVASASSCCS